VSNRAAAFTEVDLKRALRAATKAGWPVKSVEITREGTIRLLQASPPSAPALDEAEVIDLG
jgi:hypothetical protein